MSDKAEKKDAAAGDEKKGAGGGLMTKLPVLLGGVMIIEAIVLFAGIKLFGGSPKPSQGAELSKDEGHGGEADGHGDHGEGGHSSAADKKRPAEVHVVDDFRSPNKVSGHTYFYDVSIVALTKGDSADKVKATIEARGSLIKDRLRTIIAQSDPEKLGGGSEPGLETFRRQVKFQLDEIVGEGLIDEVLVPKCIPFRTDF
jgi:flagellar basal body-associated protein FliL